MNTLTIARVVTRVEGEGVLSRTRKHRKPSSVSAADHAQRSGHPEMAARIAGEVLADDDSNIGALETLAKAQWQAARHDELLGTLARLIRLNPYEPGYHALRGAALQCLGRYGDSIRSYLRGADSPGARDSSAELRAWQSQLVETLLKEDLVFRAHYARNPEEACRSRGFEFLTESNIRQWFLTDASARSALFTRPS